MQATTHQLTPLSSVATIVLEAPAQPLGVAVLLGKPTAALRETQKDLFVTGLLPCSAGTEGTEFVQRELGALLSLLALSRWLLDGLPKAWEGLLADQRPSLTMLCLLSLNLQQCAEGREPVGPQNRKHTRRSITATMGAHLLRPSSPRLDGPGTSTVLHLVVS